LPRSFANAVTSLSLRTTPANAMCRRLRPNRSS
jgi:hypothetical protein